MLNLEYKFVGYYVKWYVMNVIEKKGEFGHEKKQKAKC